METGVSSSHASKMADTGARTRSAVLVALVVFLRLKGVVYGGEQSNTHVQYLSYPDFQTFIEDSHVRIVYFKRRVEPPNVKSFLREYDDAAQVLAAYGIQLGLIECNSAPAGVPHCPNDETAERFAYGFRESVEKIALPLETLYDVNSIVSSALHLALIHNVPIIQRQSERKELEDDCKLKCNIIYTFQRVLGTYEHRVFMEAAHRFFDRYIFAMTTTESATHGLTTIDSEGEPSAILEEPAVWVLLCQHVTDITKDCLHTNYRNPMDIQNFIEFLERLDLPDWVELSPGASQASNVYESHNLHSIFLVYDAGAREKVLTLAPELGLRFKGIAGVFVINVEEFSPDHLLKIGFYPENLKPPAIGFKAHGQVKVSVINEYDNAYQFIVDQLKSPFGSQSLQQNSFELVEELDELQQDDEVALAVQSSEFSSHLDDVLFPTLTEERYNTFIKSKAVAAVLFYLHWDPASNVALDVFSRIADNLDSTNLITVGRVDCFDWTDICEQENITVYPTVKVFRKGVRMVTQPHIQEPIALLTSLVLYGSENPVLIQDKAALETFISGEVLLPGGQVVILSSVLLGKDLHSDNFNTLFELVGKEFHGLVRIGLCKEPVLHHIFENVSQDVPFAITYKPTDLFENRVVMMESITAESLQHFIKESSLEVFPELNEYNFPDYRQEDKLLALVFMQRGRHQDVYTAFGKIAASNKHIRFAWMDLLENATQSVKTIFSPNTKDDELTLIVVDYKKAYIYVYDGDILEATSVQRWIHELTSEMIKPSKMLSSGDWKPRLPGFDYLKFIDEDQFREGEDRYLMDAALDDWDKLHQSRLFRLPGSSDKRLRMKPREEMHHQHTEL